MPDDSNAPRQRPRLRDRIKLPQVSGTWTVLCLLICFVVTATTIPLVLKKPLWVELEIVVVVWWVVWCIALTRLLYRGERVADDHAHHKGRDWFGLKNTSGSDLNGCSGGGDGEGCLAILALIVALFLAWIVLEFAIPIVFTLLYFLIRGMLVHVVHDRPNCQGDLGRSLLHGGLWATLYSAPLALVIWMIHRVN